MLFYMNLVKNVTNTIGKQNLNIASYCHIQEFQGDIYISYITLIFILKPDLMWLSVVLILDLFPLISTHTLCHTTHYPKVKELHF